MNGREESGVNRPALLQRQSSSIETVESFWQGKSYLGPANRRTGCDRNGTARCEPYSARQYTADVCLLLCPVSWYVTSSTKLT